MEETVLRVLDIVGGTSVDGPGLRTSIYLAGCIHRCPGCHNPQSWDFAAGREMTIGAIMDVVRENGFNVTLSGGDPLVHIKEVTVLARMIKAEGYGIWLYTGYRYEDLLTLDGIEELLPLLDVIVDGPFIESRRNLGLHFRGSENQRLIDVPRSFRSSTVVEVVI